MVKYWDASSAPPGECMTVVRVGMHACCNRMPYSWSMQLLHLSVQWWSGRSMRARWHMVPDSSLMCHLQTKRLLESALPCMHGCSVHSRKVWLLGPCQDRDRCYEVLGLWLSCPNVGFAFWNCSVQFYTVLLFRIHGHSFLSCCESILLHCTIYVLRSHYWMLDEVVPFYFCNLIGVLLLRFIESVVSSKYCGHLLVLDCWVITRFCITVEGFLQPSDLAIFFIRKRVLNTTMWIWVTWPVVTSILSYYSKMYELLPRSAICCQ